MPWLFVCDVHAHKIYFNDRQIENKNEQKQKSVLMTSQYIYQSNTICANINIKHTF